MYNSFSAKNGRSCNLWGSYTCQCQDVYFWLGAPALCFRLRNMHGGTVPHLEIPLCARGGVNRCSLFHISSDFTIKFFLFLISLIMYRQNNTPPTYDEANAANQPTPSEYPPPLGYYLTFNSTSRQGYSQSYANNNLPTTENNICGYSPSGIPQRHDLTSPPTYDSSSTLHFR